MTTATALTVSFPGVLPDMQLATNQRTNLIAMSKVSPRQAMAILSRRVREDRARWGELFAYRPDRAEIVQWFDEYAPPYAMTWTVRFDDARNRDADGVLSALKTAIDAMVDVGLLPDDRGITVPTQTIDLVFGADNTGVTLTVTQKDGTRRLPL